MERLIAILGRGNKYFCAALLGCMVLVVFANTMLRYLFNSGIIMGEELVKFMLVWAVYLSVISVYYEHRHIAVTTLQDRIPKRYLPLFNFIANFGALYALFLLCQGSVMYYYETTTMGQATGLPYKVMAIPVCIAAVVCFFIVVVDMYRQLCQFKRGESQ